MMVSVIVATYKREYPLKNALESLMNQSYEDIEVIVVDDNANEEWNEKVSKIISEFEENKIVYIQNKCNKGSAETRNIGIKAATGDYITFLDDDDIYLPNKIKNQVEYMKHNKLDFSITDLELLNEKGKTIEKRTREYIKEYSKVALFKYHLMHHMTGTDTMMFKKDYLIDIGGFPGIDVGDEFYLMYESIDAGGSFGYLHECDVKAYVHSETNGLSSGDGKIKGENALYEFKKKHFDKLDKKSIRYIKMRHYAVIAFAEVRRKRYFEFFKSACVAMVVSPINCIKLVMDR